MILGSDRDLDAFLLETDALLVVTFVNETPHGSQAPRSASPEQPEEPIQPEQRPRPLPSPDISDSPDLLPVPSPATPSFFVNLGDTPKEDETVEAPIACPFMSLGRRWSFKDTIEPMLLQHFTTDLACFVCLLIPRLCEEKNILLINNLLVLSLTLMTMSDISPSKSPTERGHVLRSSTPSSPYPRAIKAASAKTSTRISPTTTTSDVSASSFPN